MVLIYIAIAFLGAFIGAYFGTRKKPGIPIDPEAYIDKPYLEEKPLLDYLEPSKPKRKISNAEKNQIQRDIAVMRAKSSEDRTIG